jgi:hypothetical protein
MHLGRRRKRRIRWKKGAFGEGVEKYTPCSDDA